MTSDISTQIVEFVTSVMTAMGAMPRVESSESGDTLRIDVEGEGAEALLFQRGEGLRSLQTLVNTAFRRQLGEDRKVVVDCQGFRRDKDAELRQMALFLGQKVNRLPRDDPWHRTAIGPNGHPLPDELLRVPAADRIDI